MVNVDERLAAGDERTHSAESLETGAVGGDDAVKFHPRFWLLDDTVPIEEAVFLWDQVLIPADGFFALIAEREGQTQLRADAVAVGPDVADDANRATFANGVENALDYFRILFHRECCREKRGTRRSVRISEILFGTGLAGFVQLLDNLQHAVATNDGVIGHETQCGCVFENHPFGDQTLNASAVLGQERQSAFLLVGVAKNTDEDRGGFEVAGRVHVIDRNQAGFADGNFAPDDFANFALQQFADTLKTVGRHGFRECDYE